MTIPTSPPSSVMDTLRHTVLATIELIELARDQIAGAETLAHTEQGLEVLDAATHRLVSGLAEHIDGVNPQGIGEPGWFPTIEVRRAVRLYDDGAPVVMHLESGGVTHARYPRLDRKAAS